MRTQLIHTFDHFCSLSVTHSCYLFLPHFFYLFPLMPFPTLAQHTHVAFDVADPSSMQDASQNERCKFDHAHHESHGSSPVRAFDRFTVGHAQNAIVFCDMYLQRQISGRAA